MAWLGAEVDLADYPRARCGAMLLLEGTRASARSRAVEVRV
jgi:hypothetical protein